MYFLTYDFFAYICQISALHIPLIPMNHPESTAETWSFFPWTVPFKLEYRYNWEGGQGETGTLPRGPEGRGGDMNITGGGKLVITTSIQYSIVNKYGQYKYNYNIINVLLPHYLSFFLSVYHSFFLLSFLPSFIPSILLSF